MESPEKEVWQWNSWESMNVTVSILKVNCVVMKGFNDDELSDFVGLTKDRPVDVRFIEYMPFQGNEWNENKMISFDTMKKMIREVYPDLQTFFERVQRYVESA